ncbi:LOW QUALITY PROTEIN: CLTH domain-containing protein/zf-RING_LisH domain-containing protein [Cephalotus follicularis]|uniref:CLTH domain-containing protein/zf-RING_LisH domain-containing protein n=1 Tax=Cephalotus follicularis TaxID=3775 RepID=A0A1Q3B7J8_CEPFO|nr:LOW QUALITY PROTEIN: CLTH domain-containing protein/zf-RING_LisH domain-containing protein [Cephalotus follicularis]
MEIDPPQNGAASTNSPNVTTPVTATTTATTAAAAAAAATITVPSSKLAQLTESIKLEHQFLRVPFEHYKKTIRANHRSVEKEVSSVISGVSEVAASDFSNEDAVNHLTSLVSRLQGLKRKLEEGSRTENLQAQRCRARLDHLGSVDVENISEWNNTRLKRILVDYMLRMSYYDTAVKLAESSNIQVLDLLVLVGLVIPSCAFCHGSPLTFQYLYLVVSVFQLNAPKPKKYYLSINYATILGCHNNSFYVVQILFEPKQWDYLVDQFKQEFCKLYGMTLEPLLNIYLQAGLSALKTPNCYEDDCTREDPLSQKSFRKLALPLPYSKQHHSKLVCYITKELMDTENPPQVLPNGYVYSTKALKEMSENNNGKITCPRTGLVCDYKELVKAYIS